MFGLPHGEHLDLVTFDSESNLEMFNKAVSSLDADSEFNFAEYWVSRTIEVIAARSSVPSTTLDAVMSSSEDEPNISGKRPMHANFSHLDVQRADTVMVFHYRPSF
jgi:hypothetical protein